MSQPQPFNRSTSFTNLSPTEAFASAVSSRCMAARLAKI
jgi:hypothetical protein